MTRLTDEQFQEIQSKHAGLRLRKVATPGGDIVVRPPTVAEESAFQSAYFGTSQHAGICWRNLLVTITVYPEMAQMQQLLKDWPGLNMNPAVIHALKVVRGETMEEEGK